MNRKGFARVEHKLTGWPSRRPHNPTIAFSARLGAQHEWLATIRSPLGSLLAESRAQPEGSREARLHTHSRSRRTGRLCPARVIPGEHRVAEALIRLDSRRW